METSSFNNISYYELFYLLEDVLHSLESRFLRLLQLANADFMESFFPL